MSKEQILETSGETVEQAIQQGLAILRLTPADVIVEVLDEGRTGFLGLGQRAAAVRLTVRSQPQPQETETDSAPTEHQPEAEAILDEEVAELDEFDDLDELDDLEDLPDPDLLEEEETAQYVVGQLLQKLGLKATVQSGLSQKDDRGEQVVVLTVGGDGLQELVGKKGEVLTSLQYLTRLMVSQQLRRRVDFVVDVNGYREKREEGLRRLADRMAEKVVQRGRMVTLEPMSPYDRRLIHMHLRENTAVSTRSIGLGEGRRIQIHVAGQEPTLPTSKTPATPYRPQRPNRR